MLNLKLPITIIILNFPQNHKYFIYGLHVMSKTLPFFENRFDKGPRVLQDLFNFIHIS